MLSPTSVAIDPTIRAARRLASPLRSRRPLCTTGATSASDAASTALTKAVSSKASRQRRVASPAGSASAASSAGARACSSGLRTTEPTCLRASRAATCTFGCASASAADRRGTTAGRQLPSCRGAQCAMAPSICADPCFVRHAALSSNPRSKAGRTSLTPLALRAAMRARAASSAAARTSAEPSPKAANSKGSTETT